MSIATSTATELLTFAVDGEPGYLHHQPEAA
jgi:hypothetical protein